MPDASPSVDDGTWVALTPYVTAWSTKRGRQYELDQFQAGQASLTLESFDRTFDPENTAGTYYGKLKPMRQVRIRLKWQGVVYPVFRGYVTSWGQTTEQDKKYVTTVTLRDGFERLEQIKLPSSAWALEISKDNPSAWFRLGESDTVRVTDSSPNGNYGIYDNCQQGQQGLVVNDADGAVAFAHSLEERAVIQNPNLITGYPFTFSCMVQVDSSEPGGQKMIFTGLGQPPSTSRTLFEIFLDTNSSGFGIGAGFVVMSITDGSGGGFFVWSSIRIDDNQPHHLVCVAGSSSKTDWFIYVDGVDVTTRGGGSATAWPPVTPPNGWVIGNFTDLLAGDYGFGANADGLGVASQEVHRGTIDEVCVWNGYAVTSDRIAAHSFAAKTGWAGDDTGTRVSRFLDRIRWPSTLRDIATGASTLSAASWSVGMSALSAMRAWADTELGAFFMGKDGKIVWRSRHYPLLNLNATRSRLSFADTHTAGADVYVEELNPVRDATQIRNPVIASRKDGVTVTVRDDNLADQVYGDRTWSAPTTEDRDDAAVRDRAMWLLSRYKQELTRVESMTVRPRLQPGIWSRILDLELGDRVTTYRTPLGQGSVTQLDQIVERIDWAGVGFDVKVDFTGSPVDPNVGSYLILDDATYGLLDTGLLAY